MAMYVIQVEGGRETHVCGLGGRPTSAALSTSCWETASRSASSRAARSSGARRRSDERVIPLSQDEVAWLTALMQPLDKVVEMSTGVIEGDRVIVTDGPLVGREALISKIDRHKRLAYLDMRMFGRTKTIKVGLEIVRKQA